VDWSAVGKELLAFAESRARNYQWRSSRNLVLAAGQSLEDVVQRIIEKTISSERRWDPAKGPLVPWLKDQVKSVIDALANAAVRRHETQAPEHETQAPERDSLEEFVEGPVASRSLSPEGILLEKEVDAQMKERADALSQAVNGEPELKAVVNAIRNGCEPKPRYLAAELGVSVKEINYRLKRLRRRAIKGGNP
jgi:DNA-directed RNA polymerase specialized sigma24 family protein